MTDLAVSTPSASGATADDPYLVVRTQGGSQSYELVISADGVPAAVEAALVAGDDVEVFRMEDVPFRYVVEHRAVPAA